MVVAKVKMDIFDDTIREIKEWFRGKENGGNLKNYITTPYQENANSLGKIDERQASIPSIILKEDTHLELGHPSVGSCRATLTTRDVSLIEKNRISLLGPDIFETDKVQLPFAQIVLASCKSDVEDTPSILDRILHNASQPKAYMIRSVPNLIWARVSKAGARSGFSLYGLGCRLIASLYSQCKGITGIEIFFVTSCREDVSALDKIVETARNKLRQFKTYKRMSDGTYECETGLDCEDCEEQPVCNSIRDIIKLRKGSRVISFGPE